MKKLSAPTIEWEDIAPKRAAEYLTRNVTNRPLREETMRSYEADMRGGKWVPTHQGIAFNDRGELMDGQHRLTALVRSGATIRLLVTRGLPTITHGTHTMDAVDRGAVRSIADQLRLQHGFTNPNLGIAAVALIASVVLSRGVRKQTTSQVLSGLEVYGRHIAEIGALVDNPREKRFRKAAFVAALAFARAMEPAPVDRFLKGMLSGANLEDGSPILTLRNFLLSDTAALNFSQSREDRVRMAHVVLNALRAFVQNEKLPMIVEGRAGFIYFAATQQESIKKLAKIYLIEPASLEPEAPTRRGGKIIELPPAPASHSLRPAIIKSAADIGWKPNDAVNEMLRGKEMSDRAHRRAGS